MAFGNCIAISDGLRSTTDAYASHLQGIIDRYNIKADQVRLPAFAVVCTRAARLAHLALAGAIPGL